MRYQMQERFWTLTDNYTIQDAQGRDVYTITGKFFSIGDKLSFQDQQGREVAHISQKVISLRPKYEIYREGEFVAEIIKQISLFKDKYTVDIPGPNDYTVKGNVLDHEYRFLRQGEEVAHVSKRFFSLRDVYGIDIDPDEDDVVILATAVVIDLVNEKEQAD